MTKMMAGSIGVILFFCQLGWAQTTATISGTVRDTTGAIIPGASVIIRNVDTGIARTTVTGAQGRYQAPSLISGKYEVQAEMQGFQSEVRRGIVLSVGREAVVNFELQVGAVAEVVEVTGEAPLIETTSSSVSALVETQQIQDLPLNGRSFDDLALLQPAVMVAKTQNRQIQGGFTTKMSIRGARPEQNSFLLDGTDVMGPSNAIPGGVGGQSFGVDTVREFRVETGAYSAQYGRAAGGVINVVTKSGTNSFHGTAFEFLRNDNLDARNFFDRDPSNPTVRSSPPEFKRNQFGGSLGGPILHDKTFFFGSYEALRERLGNSLVGTTVTAAARQGDLNGDGVNEITVSPLVKPYLAALFPLPNGRDLGGGIGEFISSAPEPTNEDYLSGRIDHMLGPSDSLFGRFTFDDGDRTIPDELKVQFSDVISRNQFLTIEETHIFSPAVLNTIRLGFNRTFTGLVADVQLSDSDARALAFVPGVPLFSRGTVFEVSGLSSMGEANLPRVWVWNQYEASDDISYTRGNHSLKFGGLFKTILFVQREAKSDGGEYELGSVSDLLRGTATLFRAKAVDAVGDNSWRYHYFGWYVQDDWQVRPGLTLNLGFRHEFYTGPVERTGRWCNLPHLFATKFSCAIDDGRGSNVVPGMPVWDTADMLKNFGPRAGFAWDVFGDGNTSVRGGFGIYYDALSPLWWQAPASGSFPAFSDLEITKAIDGGPLPFPNGIDELTTEAGKIDPTLTRSSVWGGDATPSAMQWNLTVQRQLGNTAVLQVGYMGSVGRHLWMRSNENIKEPTILSDGRRCFNYTTSNGNDASGSRRGPNPLCPNGSLIKRNPLFGDPRRVVTQANSNYNGLILSLVKRFSEGLQFQTSYTFSKAIDVGSNITNQSNAAGTGGTQLMDPDDWKNDRGLGDFDVRHNLSINSTWEMPFGSRLAGVTGKVLGGWQLGGVLRYSSSTPFTVDNSARNWSENGLGSRNERPDLAPGFSNDPTSGVSASCPGSKAGQKLGTPDRWFDPCAFRVQTPGFYGNVGRNTLSGPNQITMDFSLLKNIPIESISEQFRVQFRAEFFNILNRANFGTPANRALSNNRTSGGVAQGNAGFISSTTTTSRQIQFALKLVF